MNGVMKARITGSMNGVMRHGSMMHVVMRARVTGSMNGVMKAWEHDACSDEGMGNREYEWSDEGAGN
ncbi:hypothetical protein NDU88_007020 [Pleurodeles waltl]|uniref:Uncharacterized protein n=1 Tax=Pleurodeles waltl TaxID=8319 RepID=A0AAV7MHG6_PLEWA|nr:hypothetical protein NDU88_007020 [Pleurodeles waltl]